MARLQSSVVIKTSLALLCLWSLLVPGQVQSKATARSLVQQSTFNLTRTIASGVPVNCTEKRHIIDECGLMQGFSFRYQDAVYPTDHETLMKDCKRQADSMKCLRNYSECLAPLTKQVLLAMINNRKKYNKKLCTETQSDVSKRFLELNKCMQKSGLNADKGVKAEESSIGFSESIINAKFKLSYADRLKYSCCSVAQVKKEFMDATKPACAQHTHTFGDLVDSYLADTVGLICPNFDTTGNTKDCEKLAKLEVPKQLKSKYFVRPIMEVIDLLNGDN